MSDGTKIEEKFKVININVNLTSKNRFCKNNIIEFFYVKDSP